MRICKKCGGIDFYHFKCGTITCKKCHVQRAIKSQNKHKERYKEKHSIWLAEVIKKNPNYSKESSKKWRENNVEKHNEYHRLWEHKKRAKIRFGIDVLSKNIVEKLYKLQKGKCPCCNKPLGKDFHIDHILPFFLGGKNTDDNVQLLKAKCNLQKNRKHPVDFMRSRGFLL